MFSLLKKIIGVVLFVFGCFDCVKSRVIGFVVMLTANHFFTLTVIISQFMLLYTLFHCIPFRSLVFRVLGGDPWELYSKSLLPQDEDTCCWSTSESDTVVFDPENLHWSSSSLSDYLDEVISQDDNRIARPSDNKPARHSWVWTSDEDSEDESYDDGISGNDAGYMTETTTESDSSSDDGERVAETQQHLPKSSTDMICMDDKDVMANDDMKDQVLHERGVGREVQSRSSVQQESTSVVEVAIISDCAYGISSVSMAPAASTNGTDVVDDDVLILPGVTDSVVLRSDSVQVCERSVFADDVDGIRETEMTAASEDCCRDEENVIPGSSYEEATSSTDGILHSKAVRLGLLAAGVGVGAYIVYKLCCKR